MTSAWILGLVCAFGILPCIQSVHFEEQVEGVCDQPWVLAYINSAEGDVLAGNKKTLVQDIVGGKDVKVTVMYMNEAHMMKLDNLHIRDKEVYAESLSHLAHNGTHMLSVSPRRYLMVCTTGHVIQLRDSGQQTETRNSIYWYTKATSCRGKPVFSNHIDGSPARGSLNGLWRAAETMAITCVMRNRGYIFPAHNVAMEPTTGVVTAQNVRHISQYPWKKRLQFRQHPYWWFSSVNSNGKRYSRRFNLGYNPKARFNNSDPAPVDWFADKCWRTVLVHDATGMEEMGSVADLIHQIRMGHRLRIAIENVVYEVSNVRINNGVVIAQILKAVVPGGWTVPEKYDIHENATRRWIIAHTTGYIYNYEYEVGGPGHDMTEGKKAMRWIVDTRPWRVMLKTEDLGRMSHGNPFTLIEALEQGASVRLNLELDQKGGDFFTEPDNIRFDKQMAIVWAQAMDHVSDMKALRPNEYKLQPKAFHWYVLVNSDGVIRMSAWYVGRNDRNYDDRPPSARITWFVQF